MYSNLRLKKSKFKKFYQVFSIIASTCTGIQIIYKNLEGVQLSRLILRLFNALFILNCKFQYKFKKFFQVFSFIASICTGIKLIFIKNLEGVQLCRLIHRLLKALFFLYCIFQKCTAILQLKVRI